jgi:acetyl-CoA carboxylase biotin carboxyl carrier protein
VSEIKVAVGDAVVEEQEVLILESMKVLTPVHSPRAGTVESIAVEPGMYVEERALLLRLRT